MAVKEKKQISIARAKTPESVGVDSKEIQALLDDFIECGQEIHSVMVLRHGKVACEIYRDPFNAKSKHMMYSVSKSFTSAAIGFAVSEGLLSIETKLLDVFPEMRPEKTDEYLEKMNVFDLLTMQSGKAVSVFLDRTKDTWLEDFVNSPWDAEPGTKFLYISENMYVLCAMIHRVAGMSVVDYLTPRLFEPLGIETPCWETCPRGIEAGGWGLMISTEELAKFILCYQQGGKFNGKQIIPADWVEMSGKPLADNSANKDLDGGKGYGLCFWRCGGYENAYRADGMYSQFGIVLEDLDACFICTAGEIYEQPMLETIWRHVPKCFVDDDPKAEAVPLSLPKFERLRVMPRSFLEKKIEGKRIVFSKPLIMNIAGYPTSVITLPAVYMEKDKAGNINNVSFEFLENEALMTWSEGDEYNTIKIGMDGEYRWDSIVLGQTRYETCAHATWLTEDELEVRIRPIETVAERCLVFDFNGKKVTMRPSSLPTVSVMSDSIASSLKDIMKQKIVQSAADVVVPILAPIIDSPLHGKII